MESRSRRRQLLHPGLWYRTDPAPVIISVADPTFSNDVRFPLIVQRRRDRCRRVEWSTGHRVTGQLCRLRSVDVNARSVLTAGCQGDLSTARCRTDLDFCSCRRFKDDRWTLVGHRRQPTAVDPSFVVIRRPCEDTSRDRARPDLYTLSRMFLAWSHPGTCTCDTQIVGAVRIYDGG